MELIERLKRRIEMADHRPGQWFVCKSEGNALCGCNQHAGNTRLTEFFAGHDFIGRGVPRNDLMLAVEAINALPELLALAQDGLEYRAQTSGQTD